MTSMIGDYIDDDDDDDDRDDDDAADVDDDDDGRDVLWSVLSMTMLMMMR